MVSQWKVSSQALGEFWLQGPWKQVAAAVPGCPPWDVGPAHGQ